MTRIRASVKVAFQFYTHWLRFVWGATRFFVRCAAKLSLNSQGGVNREIRTLLKNLNSAEAALRANLHTHCLDETARHHMERATTHVREAYIAINEPGRARNVPQLLNDIAAGERLIAYAAAKAGKQVQLNG